MYKLTIKYLLLIAMSSIHLSSNSLAMNEDSSISSKKVGKVNTEFRPDENYNTQNKKRLLLIIIVCIIMIT